MTITARTLDPPRALAALADAISRRPVESCAPADAAGAHLARAVVIPRRAAPSAYAALNGYSVGPEATSGDERPLLGVITAAGARLGPDGEDLDENARSPSPSGVWRVETGARVPLDSDRIVPVESAELSGLARVRLQSVPPPGFGIRAAGGESGDALEWPEGAPVTPRLRALLVATPVAEVAVRRAGRVAFGSVGDELTDLAAASSSVRGDVTGYWLGDALAAGGESVVPLGIVSDSPARLGEVLLACSRRGVDSVVLSGGVGTGVEDRVVESLRRLGARIYFSGVDVVRRLGFVYAKTRGLDVLCLPGLPLAASALFDCLVVPALAARRGVESRAWDWSKRVRSGEAAHATGDESSPAGASWAIAPGRIEDRGPVAIDIAESDWNRPTVGESGWILTPPTGAEFSRAIWVGRDLTSHRPNKA